MSYQPPQGHYPHQQSTQIIYQHVVKAPTNGVSVTSMIFGIIGAAIGLWAWVPLLGIASAIVGFPLALTAVVTGHVGIARAQQLGGLGRPSALTGAILGYITLAVIIAVTVFWILAIAASAASSSSATA